MATTELFRHKKQERDGYTLWTPPGGVETYVHSGISDPHGEVEDAGLEIHNLHEVELMSRLLRATLEGGSAAREIAIEALVTNPEVHAAPPGDVRPPEA